MSTLQIVIGIFQLIAAVAIIITVLMQHGKSSNLSGAIAGGAETFFGKNKGRTIDAQLSKWTSVIAGVFVVLTIILDALSLV